MRKFPDEFQRDDVNGEHLKNDEFSFLNETEEYDERFFHQDEYNRDCYIGLINKEDDDFSDEDFSEDDEVLETEDDNEDERETI